MKTNKELLAIAKKQIGNGGSKYRKYVGVGGSWCDMFVYWLYTANGNGTLLPWKGNQRYFCPASIKWCRANLAQLPPYMAMACDIIYFDWDKNGNPNHIGIVEKRRNSDSIYTIEGNTSGGKVDDKTRKGYIQAIYRPHFVPKNVGKKKLKIDGEFEYQSIYNLQVALGMKPTGVFTKETLKYLQRRAGATPDADWGKDTTRKIQKMIGAKVDGDWGVASTKKLQEWINKINYPQTKKTPISAKKPAKTTNTSTAKETTAKATNQQKLIAKMKELAWAYGTAKNKYSFKKGAPKAVCKKALKKYGWADSKAEMSDCGNNVSATVREAGVSKSFKALHGVKTPFPKSEKDFDIVIKGRKIKSGELKPADIVRYKKQNGKQHALFYFGDGKVCEASHHNRYFAIVKDEKKYNNSKIARIGTVQVLRAKE